MTFLPIVERELRVAARRPATFWSRVLAAGAAMLIFAGVVLLDKMSRGMMGSQLGSMLFTTFSWISFGFACLTGVFLTADALSAEKRAGTLGLLFLTDLRGHDVVMGKLLAHSLQAAYGLLAAFPVIGLAFLLGGLTAAHFGRMILVLCNALFFSLAAGMFVSAISRDTQKAMTGTLALCGVFLLALPLVDWCLAGWDTTKFVPLLSLGSPAYPFTVAGNSRPQGFWAALIISHAIGWGLLVAASVLAQSMWQEKTSTQANAADSRPHRWRFGGPATRARLRQELLHPNPIRWLAGRDRWARLGLWAFLGAAALFLLLLDVAVTQREVVGGMAYGLCWLAALLLKIWLASQAARFFVEGLENGTLELLLVSPVRPEEIVRGQGWALRRTFLLPAVILLAGNGMMGLAQVYEMMNTMRASAATTAAGAPASVTVTMMDQMVWNQLISLVGGLITFVTGLWAVAWFGMWMGLTSRKVHVAVIKTLVFVQVLPTFALMLVQGLLMFGAAFNQWPFWIGSIVTVVLAIGVHVAFVLGSRRALLGNLRQMVAEPERRGTWRRPFGKLR